MPQKELVSWINILIDDYSKSDSMKLKTHRTVSFVNHKHFENLHYLMNQSEYYMGNNEGRSMLNGHDHGLKRKPPEIAGVTYT